MTELTTIDRFHERRIAALAMRYRLAMGANNKRAASIAWNAMAKAIEARSAAQVAYMEEQRHLRSPERRGFHR